jgi:histidyl-tRNA synthetase
MSKQITKRDRKTGVPSGFADMLPIEKSRFNELMRILGSVVEKYDFTPIETPTVEWMDTLKGQDDTGGKLIYGVQNGYDLEAAATESLEFDKGLRFDLTLPLARYITDHSHELPMPFRRYHQGNVFRGETAQTGKGRYREFTQFDADIVGAGGATADAEIAAMLCDAMNTLQLPAVVKINNRLILDGLIEIGLKSSAENAELSATIFRIIDKYDKIGEQKVIEEIKTLTQEDAPEFTKIVTTYLQSSGSALEKIAQLRELLADSKIAQAGLDSIEQIFSLLEAAGYEDQQKISFAPEIVRGLGYYTGVIYETLITGYEQYGSVASGGRYDRLISDLGGPDLPAVGASFGVSRLLDVLVATGWQAGVQTPAQVFIARFTTENESSQKNLNTTYFEIAANLRKQNIPVHLFSEDKKIGQQLKFAGEVGIPYALLIGENELSSGVATIRNLQTRDQEEVAIENLTDFFSKIMGTLT